MIQRYELSQKEYVPVITENGTSYGGAQQWFSTKLPKSKQARMHKYGCGVIAACDLFMYWAMTLPYQKEGYAHKTLERDGNLLKENYMIFAEYIRDRYIYIPPKVGAPIIELVLAINRYAIKNALPYKAKLGYLTNPHKLLRQMIQMIRRDIPVIMLIGASPLSRLMPGRAKNTGVPFYTGDLKKEPDGNERMIYKVSDPGVKGHFVVVTGIIINKEAATKKEKVMLKISSWGKTYYISYYEYCRYEIKNVVDIQGSIVYVSPR